MPQYAVVTITDISGATGLHHELMSNNPVAHTCVVEAQFKSMHHLLDFNWPSKGQLRLRQVLAQVSQGRGTAAILGTLSCNRETAWRQANTFHRASLHGAALWLVENIGHPYAEQRCDWWKTSGIHKQSSIVIGGKHWASIHRAALWLVENIGHPYTEQRCDWWKTSGENTCVSEISSNKHK